MTWTHIEITGGTVAGPTRIDRRNIGALDFKNIGNRIFFAEAVGPDGGRLVLHDGFDHAAVLTAAREAAAGEGIPVLDCMAGGG